MQYYFIYMHIVSVLINAKKKNAVEHGERLADSIINNRQYLLISCFVSSTGVNSTHTDSYPNNIRR